MVVFRQTDVSTHKMKFIIISVFLTLIFFSCREESKNREVKDEIESTEYKIDSSENKLIPKIDKVIFYNVLDSSFYSNEYISEPKILEVSKIPELLELLYSESSPRYLGAGGQRPAFHLFNNNKHVQTFLIDKFKNSYHLFKHFHEVKKLDSIKLSVLLNEGINIKHYYLRFENVNDARVSLELADSSNLSIIHKNTYSEPKWIQFDGEFVFSYSCLLKDENSDSIFEVLKTKLDENKYEIAYPQSLREKDSVKLSYRIYSNNDTYTMFKTEFENFEYISTFKGFKPRFRLFCHESEYKKIKTRASTIYNK